MTTRRICGNILFRFPAAAADAPVQINRLLSGSGTHASHPEGPTNYALKWHGQPRATLRRRESWIALAHRGLVYGWGRYCHYKPSLVAHFGDPAVRRLGPALVVDRIYKLPAPFTDTTTPRRSHYISAATAGAFSVPPSSGGARISWVDSSTGACREGCYVHGM